LISHKHLHIKFIKEILGVHCKATNVACLAELNRYPLRGRIQLATIKFLEHILNANNSLVNKVYSSTAKNSKWLHRVDISSISVYAGLSLILNTF
jgi:hypothetical protein